MVGGRLKSRKSLRRVFVRTPSGENKIHYRKRKPSRPICAECGAYLHGIPHLIKSKFKNIAKTKKRPQRPYGGVLCSRCMREKIRNDIK